MNNEVTRRGLLRTLGAVAGAAVVVPHTLRSAVEGGTAVGADGHLEPAARLRAGRAADDVLHRSGCPDGRPGVQRAGAGEHVDQALWTGALWAEGPAWNSQGRYLLWSDIPNNRQMRWLEDDGRVTVFRSPSNNSNGNTFDYQGRQLSCEHLDAPRRPLRARRFDHDHRGCVPGQATELAERRGPFTRTAASGSRIRPTAGSYTRERRTPRRADQRGRPLQSASRAAGGDSACSSGSCRRTSIASIPAAASTSSIGEEQVPDPNGLTFSPDFRKLYVASTGKGPGDTGAGRQGRGLRVRRRRRQQGCRTGSCSPIA